jgi:hypothetical protein
MDLLTTPTPISLVSASRAGKPLADLEFNLGMDLTSD